MNVDYKSVMHTRQLVRVMLVSSLGMQDAGMQMYTTIIMFNYTLLHAISMQARVVMLMTTASERRIHESVVQTYQVQV